MARTFKQYGCAYDTSGSVDVVVSIGGVEVFNGSVVAETENHESNHSESELFSFELAEEVSGNTTWEVSVTGTDESSQLRLGPLECNMVGHPNTTIPLSYFLDTVEENGGNWNTPFPADKQLYVDTTLGNRITDADIRARLQAGTSIPYNDASKIMLANEEPGEDSSVFLRVTKTLSNGQIDGEAYDVTVENMWPNCASGHTLTMTANLTIPAWSYDPALILE